MMRVRSDLLRTLEAGTVGLFLIQAVRFLYATLYARASSGSSSKPNSITISP